MKEFRMKFKYRKRKKLSDKIFPYNLSEGRKLFKFICEYCDCVYETNNPVQKRCKNCLDKKTQRYIKDLKVVYNNIPLYNTYAPQISFCESVRRDPEDNNILQVKCAYCGKWYRPTRRSVCLRIAALKNQLHSKGAEVRFYCSKECKQLCPIFNQKTKYKFQEGQGSREVQPELRQLVFERDNWTCIKCGSTKGLQCHHVEGIHYEPLESADIDKCITVCKKCHSDIHKINGCGYQDMRCN
jgi:hypothetical protein